MGCSYRRILCWCTRTQPTAQGRLGEGLGHQGGAERRAGALLARGLRPMIEAGAPSTGGYVACSYGVPAPPGVVMVSPPEVPRNAERGQSEGPRQVRQVPSAAEGIIRAGTL